MSADKTTPETLAEIKSTAEVYLAPKLNTDALAIAKDIEKELDDLEAYTMPDTSTDEGFDAAKALEKKHITARNKINKARLAITKPYRDATDKVNKRITDVVIPRIKKSEAPLAAAVLKVEKAREAAEAKRAAEAEAALAADIKRVAAHKATASRIQGLGNANSLEAIPEALGALANYRETYDFEEFREGMLPELAKVEERLRERLGILKANEEAKRENEALKKQLADAKRENDALKKQAEPEPEPAEEPAPPPEPDAVPEETMPAHAEGLATVPDGGYVAELHPPETADELLARQEPVAEPTMSNELAADIESVREFLALLPEVPQFHTTAGRALGNLFAKFIEAMKRDAQKLAPEPPKK